VKTKRFLLSLNAIIGCLLVATSLVADDNVESYSVPPGFKTAELLQTSDNQIQLSRFQWKPIPGIRIGAVALSGGTFSMFLENQFNDHWSIRPAVEYVVYHDTDFEDGFARDSYDVKHIGLAVDCIYYAKRRRTNCTGLYLHSGLGLYRITLKEECNRWDYSDIGLAISIGFGYTGKYIGFEVKLSTSTVNSPTNKNIGGEWGQFGLNFRFGNFDKK